MIFLPLIRKQQMKTCFQTLTLGVMFPMYWTFKWTVLSMQLLTCRSTISVLTTTKYLNKLLYSGLCCACFRVSGRACRMLLSNFRLRWREHKGAPSSVQPSRYVQSLTWWRIYLNMCRPRKTGIVHVGSTVNIPTE